MESEKIKVAKAAGVVGLATMMSRIFGYIRDMVVANFFGAGLATDAFFVAFRIPNLLRRLLGEGSLTISFIPIFTEYLKNRSKEEALDLANVSFTILSIILVAVSMTGILLSPAIVAVMAPGWYTSAPDKFALTVLLNRIMFPYIFFISLVALCMGILNSLRHFATPALSPVILNLSMIGATIILKDFFAEPILALAVGVMIGGILQLAVQFPFLKKMGVNIRPDFNFRHPGVRRIGILMLPAIFGSAVYQINIFISTLLASFLPEGSVSFLYYADRIVELPLGVFAIAIGTAALPSFSEQVSKGNFDDLKKTLSFSLRLMLFITIPASIALIVLREPIVSVLFQRGEFDHRSTILTAQALLCYTVGLWAFSTIRVVVAAFYALQDTKTPVRIAIVALIVNTILSAALMFPLKHNGLALATSIASAVNVTTLFILLSRRIGWFLDRPFYQSILKVSLSSTMMAVVIVIADRFFAWNLSGSFRERIIALSVAIVIGGTTFIASSYLVKSSELMSLIEAARRKLNGPFRSF